MQYAAEEQNWRAEHYKNLLGLLSNKVVDMYIYLIPYNSFISGENVNDL